MRTMGSGSRAAPLPHAHGALLLTFFPFFFPLSFFLAALGLALFASTSAAGAASAVASDASGSSRSMNPAFFFFPILSKRLNKRL